MKPSIRIATIKDLQEVARLFDQYRQFYGKASDLTNATAFLRDRMQRGESVIFIARDDQGNATGFAQLYPLFCSVAMKPQWLLYDLFVEPAARRSGTARALLERCHQLGVETGSHALFLETATGNLAAQRLYESSGWTRESEFVKYNYWP